MGLTRSLAREVGPRGIRVNTLSPGWVMTERQKSEFVTPCGSAHAPPVPMRSRIDSARGDRPGSPFLASEASRVLTGQEILADRGWAYS